MLSLRNLVFLAVLAVPLTADTNLHISGTVSAGHAFRKEIGSGLALVLVPNDDSGWTIEVQPLDGSDNFVRCVTLPLHGPTPADVLATQFVTEDNNRLPEAELSEVKKREFQFVLNAADQKKACAEMEEEAYGQPKTAPDGTVIIGNPEYEQPLLGSGSFRIKRAQLSDLGSGQRAHLESINFEAEIKLPKNGLPGQH